MIMELLTGGELFERIKASVLLEKQKNLNILIIR
jgi:hypothetical protein